MRQLPRHHGWSIARVVPLLAGTFVLISALAAAAFSAWWLILTGFVGANLLLYSAVGWCPATLLLARLGVPAGPATCATSRT
ncbi:DUF2892 domain-containing protein [Nocardia sp. NEAU-G5]|uniref:DUF2892 domain-containing protein n=2 Tax=Nocardia albiluteola TaxID=2842303 RepID=A0ABS6BAK2_9NOCA|nr:DUF2892 domain-containing protein [Nocardia albiluteola]MBU3067322.1 DUF2892 domain-containing protein [Nocardia albiluteola]